MAPPDTKVDDATLQAAQSTLSKAANKLEPLQRSLKGQDADVVGADPLSERLRNAQANLAGGIGIVGQGMTTLAKYTVDTGTSFGNTDGNLTGGLPRGVR